MSNGSTDATCIEIDNTGDGIMTVNWVGGKLTTAGSDGKCLYVTGGNNVDTMFSSTFFQSRASSNPDVAVVVDDGCSGISIINCVFGLGAYTAAHFDYPIRFNGQVSNLVLTGNRAGDARSGLLIDWVSQPTTLFETRIIKDNITPDLRLPYSVSMSGLGVTAATIPLNDEAAYKIRAIVLGRTGTTSNRSMYEVVGLFYRDGGGVATLQGSLVTPIAVESASAMDATLSVSGNDVNLVLGSISGQTTVFDYDLEIIQNT